MIGKNYSLKIRKSALEWRNYGKLSFREVYFGKILSIIFFVLKQNFKPLKNKLSPKITISLSLTVNTPTKQSNAQHLVEHEIFVV